MFTPRSLVGLCRPMVRLGAPSYKSRHSGTCVMLLWNMRDLGGHSHSNYQSTSRFATSQIPHQQILCSAQDHNVPVSHFKPNLTQLANQLQQPKQQQFGLTWAERSRSLDSLPAYLTWTSTDSGLSWCLIPVLGCVILFKFELWTIWSSAQEHLPPLCLGITPSRGRRPLCDVEADHLLLLQVKAHTHRSEFDDFQLQIIWRPPKDRVKS